MIGREAHAELGNADLLDAGDAGEPAEGVCVSLITVQSRAQPHHVQMVLLPLSKATAGARHVGYYTLKRRGINPQHSVALHSLTEWLMW